MRNAVILIAGGHPLFSHYAYNLALSIRNHSDVPIILFAEGPGMGQLFEDQKNIFTDILDLPREFYMHNGQPHYVKAKLHLYDLVEQLEYDEFLYLDADMIFSPFQNIENLFKENRDCDIQFACRGEKQMHEGTKSEWVNLADIKEVHSSDHWYEVSSEVIYFKRSETAQRVFDCAQYYYTNHGMDVKRWELSPNMGWRVEDKPKAIMEFAGGIPDEVPFSLALEATGVKIKAPYSPSYWQPQYFNKVLPDVEVQKKFYLISIGGATLQPNTKRIYNNLAKHYSQRTELKRAFYPAKAKRDELKERKRI